VTHKNQQVLFFQNEDNMTDDNKNKSAFPVGYHDFHKDPAFNFPLNRWYSMGYARFENLKEGGQKISSFEDWKIEMLKLAELAVSEGRLMNAAFFYRAAELFITREDPDKELLYHKFIDCFYRCFHDDEIKKYEVPYNNAFLPAIRIQPVDKEKRGTVVLHGGFDSFMEELYSMMRYFSDHGYEVIAFDGPGQGAARKKYGLAFDYEWEKPAKAILNHFRLRDVTWFGISMGGWLALRAAAFEPRIKRVIASSVSFDVFQYTNIVGQLVAKLLLRHFRNFTNNAMVKKMKKNLMYSWFASNLMYMTNKEVPIEAFDVLLQLNEENLHSDMVKQDVLILTGKEDHLVPFKMHRMQVNALTNAESVTARVFTEEENAQNHCQVGNIGLKLDVARKWIEKCT
jgi:alpha-beta hydrolase superfamily lysophospholipase